MGRSSPNYRYWSLHPTTHNLEFQLRTSSPEVQYRAGAALFSNCCELSRTWDSLTTEDSYLTSNTKSSHVCLRYCKSTELETGFLCYTRGAIVVLNQMTDAQYHHSRVISQEAAAFSICKRTCLSILSAWTVSSPLWISAGLSSLCPQGHDQSRSHLYTDTGFALYSSLSLPLTFAQVFSKRLSVSGRGWSSLYCILLLLTFVSAAFWHTWVARCGFPVRPRAQAPAPAITQSLLSCLSSALLFISPQDILYLPLLWGA